MATRQCVHMKMDGSQCKNMCYQSESGCCYNHKKCAVLTPCKEGCGKYTRSKTGYCYCTAKICNVLKKMKLEKERDELLTGYHLSSILAKN